MTKKTPIIAAATVLSTLVACPSFGQETTTSSSPYDTGKTMSLIAAEDVDYDTGWVPAGSSIQVRFLITAGNTASVDMSGTAHYDWADETITLEGDVAGGEFLMNYGLAFSAFLKFDIAGVAWEGPIGEPTDFLMGDTVEFDPYLLPGGEVSAVHLSDDVQKTTLYEYNAVDVIVASVGLTVYISGGLEADFNTDRVSIAPRDGGDAAELSSAQSPAALQFSDGAAAAQADATLSGTLDWTPTITLWPSAVVTIGLTDYPLAEFALPIPLTGGSDPWEFESELLTFDRIADTDSNDEDSDSTTGDDETDAGPDTDTDSDIDAATSSCDCAATGAKLTPAADGIGRLLSLIW